MNKEEAQEAIRKISNIIDQWTDMRMDANDALELLLPLLKTVTSYFDLDPAAEKKRSMYEDLEEGLESETEENLKMYDPEEKEELQKEKSKEKEKDLFGRKDEEETDND
jgi:hypothetical protein